MYRVAPGRLESSLQLGPRFRQLTWDVGGGCVHPLQHQHSLRGVHDGDFRRCWELLYVFRMFTERQHSHYKRGGMNIFVEKKDRPKEQRYDMMSNCESTFNQWNIRCMTAISHFVVGARFVLT